VISVLVVLSFAVLILAVALALDGKLPRAPLERLANWPFQGPPATNGALLVFAVLAIGIFAHWLFSGAG
jgi:hypothetical protein